MLYSLFLLYAQVKVYQNMFKLRYKPFALTLYKTFLKNEGLELVSLPHFLHDL